MSVQQPVGHRSRDYPMSSSICVMLDARSGSILARRSSVLARPYIARLRVFSLLTCPSVWPLLQSCSMAFLTASHRLRKTPIKCSATPCQRWIRAIYRKIRRAAAEDCRLFPDNEGPPTKGGPRTTEGRCAYTIGYIGCSAGRLIVSNCERVNRGVVRSEPDGLQVGIVVGEAMTKSLRSAPRSRLAPMRIDSNETAG